MEKKTKFLKPLCLGINLFLFISALFIFINMPLNGYTFGIYEVPGGDPSYFRYFTNLSNMYGGLVSLVIALYLACHYEEEFYLPKWLRLLQFSVVVSLTLTFLTVLFFLVPAHVASPNFFDMFARDFFFFHFLNPVLSVVVFLCLTKGDKLTWKECFVGMVPMVIYAATYASCVLTGAWPDFYGFTFGGQYWLIALVLPIMLGATYGISVLLSFVYNKTHH